MASQWHSLISQKLFLARTLLGQLQQSAAQGDQPSLNEAQQAMAREASIQGAIELLLRSRQLVLVMVARLYQKKSEEPATLDELAALIGPDQSEISQLRDLEQRPGGWWNHLEQLERSQSRPPVPKKTVSAENIIAVSADSGPDRSAKALLETLNAIKHFADDLEHQHSEW